MVFTLLHKQKTKASIFVLLNTEVTILCGEMFSQTGRNLKKKVGFPF